MLRRFLLPATRLAMVALRSITAISIPGAVLPGRMSAQSKVRRVFKAPQERQARRVLLARQVQPVQLVLQARQAQRVPKVQWVLRGP
jgi:hypothetical protein